MNKRSAKILRLDDMILTRQGSFLQRIIHAGVSLSLRLFFRRIETSNAAVVPEQGALIFVMNHPNGLIDPSLVFVALPRKISFLAKSTLFDIPIISSILRLVEALPVYRRIDSADVTKNQRTFEACHDQLQKGGAIALFPEGVSHNSPKLLPIKTGAARIALGALSGEAGEVDFDLKIVPVGLYYTNKTTFRSDALLQFGTPFEVDPPKSETGGEPLREEVDRLSARIDEALRDVTVNAETKAHLEEASAGANLFFSVSETLSIEGTIAEKFEFVRKYLDRLTGDSNEEGSLTQKISKYKKKLRELGLEPENLSLSNEPVWYVLKKFVFRGLLLLWLSPFSLIGSLLHFPAYQFSKFLAGRYTHHGVDDIISTVKIISGMVLIPATWLITAVVLYYFTRSVYSIAAVPVAALLGYISLRSWEAYSDLRGWFKASWLFIAKRHVFLDLLSERRRLYKGLRGIK